MHPVCSNLICFLPNMHLKFENFCQMGMFTWVHIKMYCTVPAHYFANYRHSPIATLSMSSLLFSHWAKYWNKHLHFYSTLDSLWRLLDVRSGSSCVNAQLRKPLITSFLLSTVFLQSTWIVLSIDVLWLLQNNGFPLVHVLVCEMCMAIRSFGEISYSHSI